jgi:hypothetical protein
MAAANWIKHRARLSTQLRRLRYALVLLAVAMTPGCSGYDIVLANGEDAPVQVSIKSSDGSLSQELTIDGHSWAVVGLRPRRDCHLIISATRDGQALTSKVGYYENGSFGSECFVIRADGTLGAC